MAAQQARDLTEDKNIIVIPPGPFPGNHGIGQFYAGFGTGGKYRTMTEEMGNVRTAQITYAVHHHNIDGIDIEEGISWPWETTVFYSGKICGRGYPEAMKEMLDDESELVTIYYGADV